MKEKYGLTDDGVIIEREDGRITIAQNDVIATKKNGESISFVGTLKNQCSGNLLGRHCGSCSFNDGLCYTSNPPKYRCTFDNNFYDGLHECHLELKPVEYAEWIDHGYEIECSACGFTCSDEYYLGEKVACPNCGRQISGTIDIYKNEKS